MMPPELPSPQERSKYIAIFLGSLVGVIGTTWMLQILPEQYEVARQLTLAADFGFAATAVLAFLVGKTK